MCFKALFQGSQSEATDRNSGILSEEVKKCFSRCVDPMVHSLKSRVDASDAQVRQKDETTILDLVVC